jgi:2,4-dienoyl-CoA reductase-like NADH-dependent reductase (Old Yellow Enzyme family)
VPWEGRVPLAHCPGVDHGEEWELIGPSPVAHSEKSAVPRQMTRADIGEVVKAWGKAAQRADKAGFDVVEIHGGHGYLIHQFLSPGSNRRTDEYGGSIEKRMRFALEVTREVRRCWPQGKPVFFRVSAVDEAGWTIEDSVALAKLLKQNGVDVIDCSSGGMSEVVLSETTSPLGYQVPYAQRVRDEADILTMAVGMIVYADQAEAILREGKADLIALGREFLHNPHWPLDAAQKLGIAAPFAHVARPYAYWLEKRWRSNFGKPSTWHSGINTDSDKKN